MSAQNSSINCCCLLTCFTNMSGLYLELNVFIIIKLANRSHQNIISSINRQKKNIMNTCISLIIMKYHRKFTTFVHTIPITLHECMQSLIYLYICMLIAFLLLDGWLCFNGNDDILLERRRLRGTSNVWNDFFMEFLNQLEVHLKKNLFLHGNKNPCFWIDNAHTPSRTYISFGVFLFCYARESHIKKRKSFTHKDIAMGKIHNKLKNENISTYLDEKFSAAIFILLNCFFILELLFY